MTNASANTKQAHGAHSHSSDDRAHGAGDAERSSAEFLSSVRSLKDAEKSAAHKVEEAKKEAAKIEAHAREKAVEIQAKASEKAVAAKNELLLSGRQKADSEIKEITAEAQKQAAKIKAKKLSEKDVASISERVL